MQALDLYGKIQEYLDFEEEIETLYKATLFEVIKRDIESVIDIGCGQGEFCNILEYNNIKTLGVDLSKTQINLAKKKFPKLSFQAVDIANITQNFSCATATFDVINYLLKNELKTFFKNTYSLLEDEGYFIFDVNSYFGFEEIAQGTLIIDNENIFIGIDANFEEEILYTDLFVFSKEKKHYNKQTGTIQQYYHSRETLEELLKDSGFAIEEIIDFNLHSDDESDKTIYVCKKVSK